MTPHICQSPFFFRSLVLHLLHSHGWQMSIMTNGNSSYFSSFMVDQVQTIWLFEIIGYFLQHDLDWIIQLASYHNVLPILNISSHHGSHCHFDEGKFSHVKNTTNGVVYILKSFFHFTKGIEYEIVHMNFVYKMSINLQTQLRSFTFLTSFNTVLYIHF